jgi:hypothetical protein
MSKSRAKIYLRSSLLLMQFLGCRAIVAFVLSGLGDNLRRVAAILAFFVTWVTTSTAYAQVDYDPRNLMWNGASELVQLASTSDIDVRPVRMLDWSTVRARDAILVLFPRQRLGVVDLSAFLHDGGRVAWFDDFGASSEVYDWFQFRRELEVRGTPRTPELPELLIARPRSSHALTDGVDVLLTNIPVALSHPRLTPVFDFPPGGQGAILVGQIGRGKLIAGGDPSVFLNTMMRFPGNRRFARNVLEFLSSSEGGKIYLVWGDAQSTGLYVGRDAPRTRTRGAINQINTLLKDASHVLAHPNVLRPFALLIALATACVMAVLVWGRRPGERYGPRGPVGTAAGIAERVQLYTSDETRNLLIPALRLRRVIEQAILRASGDRPPLDVRASLLRLKHRLSEPQRTLLAQRLAELDTLASAASEHTPPTVTPARFLSLWNGIGAILRSLSDKRS